MDSKEGRDFKELTKQDSEKYAKKSISHLAPALQHHIFSSSNRYRYIQRKLQEVIAQATYILSEQARKSGFSPVGIELGFGMQDDLPPVTISLPNGYELVLRGELTGSTNRFMKTNYIYVSSTINLVHVA